MCKEQEPSSCVHKQIPSLALPLCTLAMENRPVPRSLLPQCEAGVVDILAIAPHVLASVLKTFFSLGLLWFSRSEET